MVNVTTDLRPTFVPVRDQGVRPTCTSFAVSDGHASVRNELIALSPEHLHYHGVLRGGSTDPDQGIYLETALEALEHDGQCFEPGWPYITNVPIDPALWKPPTSAVPAFRRIATTAKSKVLDFIVGAVDSGRPVVFVMLLGEQFYKPAQGIVDQGPQDSDVAWHSLVAVGTGAAAGQPGVLVRNSWGPAWGEDGYAWITHRYLSPRISVAATLDKEN